MLAELLRRLRHPDSGHVWLEGAEGIEYIRDDVVGDRLIFHVNHMPPYRQYFNWSGERLVAIVDRGEVAVMRAADLEPKSIPQVWCDEWSVEP